MKIITILLLVSGLTLNDKLFGIWKSTDNNSVQYLNFKSDGKLLEVNLKDFDLYLESQPFWLSLILNTLIERLRKANIRLS